MATSTMISRSRSYKTERKPRCQCEHSGGAFGAVCCERLATLRATVVCRAEGCADPAAVYELCDDCAHRWMLVAETDPGGPRLEVAPL